MRLVPVAAALAAAAGFIAAGGCAHITYPVGPLATPTPAASATPSTAPCNATGSTSAQIVAVSPQITPTISPTYGLIAGYGPVASGNVSNVAAPIVVTPGSSVQFFDNDVTGSQLQYSAVGIVGATSFPAPTYTFPPAATVQTGTAISATALWSTGLMAGQCYSQVFAVPSTTGVYYFGDYTYYALGNIRDVIVVATPVP